MGTIGYTQHEQSLHTTHFFHHDVPCLFFFFFFCTFSLRVTHESLPETTAGLRLRLLGLSPTRRKQKRGRQFISRHPSFFTSCGRTGFFLGCVVEPREGGGIHTAGGVASGKRGCDERDAGKKKKGGGRTGEWKVPICLAKPWQSVELISLANLHSHTHQRFLEEGGGGGSGELLGCLFWLCLFRIRGKGKGEDIPRVMLLLRREEGKMGTRENGGMENGLNE